MKKCLLMRNLVALVFLLTSELGFGQNTATEDFNLVGIWTITDFNDPDQFEDIWEFTAAHIFNELKYPFDGAPNLVPDETGTWLLLGEGLQITITGEDINGTQENYETPQVMEFEVIVDGSEVILKLIVDDESQGGGPVRLRMSKS